MLIEPDGHADSADRAVRAAKLLAAVGGDSPLIVVGDNLFAYEERNKIVGRVRPQDSMTDEQWHRMIDVHLGGAFNCCRAVVPAMKQQGGGKIICTASVSGMVAWGYDDVHYCAAKAGLLGLAKRLAKDLAPYKINVNAVAPGSVMTPIQRNVPPEVLETRQRENPWGRFADAREIGYLVAFLASAEADYITGQVISPNGGAVIVGI